MDCCAIFIITHPLLASLLLLLPSLFSIPAMNHLISRDYYSTEECIPIATETIIKELSSLSIEMGTIWSNIQLIVYDIELFLQISLKLSAKLFLPGMKITMIISPSQSSVTDVP